MVNNLVNVVSGVFKDYYAVETRLSYVDDKKSIFLRNETVIIFRKRTSPLGSHVGFWHLLILT